MNLIRNELILSKHCRKKCFSGAIRQLHEKDEMRLWFPQKEELVITRKLMSRKINITIFLMSKNFSERFQKVDPHLPFQTNDFVNKANFKISFTSKFGIRSLKKKKIKLTSEAVLAKTNKWAKSIHTDSIIFAWCGHTFINVVCAQCTFESTRTSTLECILLTSLA